MKTCSAPRESSHLNDFARPEFPRAPIAQRLVRARLVVPVDPRPQLPPGLLVTDEVVLPDALFLETAEEALDDPVLLRCVGGDEFLGQSVVATGRPEPPTLIDESVVGADHRRGPRRAQRAEPFQARFLERPLGLFGPPPQGKLVTDELAVVTIDHRGEVGPAILPAVHVGHVGGPALIAPRGLAAPPVDPGPRGGRPLMHEPAFESADAVDGLGRNADAIPKTQQGPQPPIAEGRVAANQGGDLHGQRLVEHRATGRRPLGPPAHAPASHRQDPAHPALGQVRPRLSHSSDVFAGKGRSLLASFSTSRSRTNSPTFCLSFLICSSFKASSSLGRARNAFSAPSRNRSRHSSTSATVNPCFRAAAWAEVSPFRMLRTKDARRFAVQRWGDSGLSSAMATSRRDPITACRWTQFGGEQHTGVGNEPRGHMWSSRGLTLVALLLP